VLASLAGEDGTVIRRQSDPGLAPLPSGRHGLSREYVRQSQRARLLAAAIHVAGTEGYAGMTVTAVTTGASVSRKTFYAFFADREACFLAALDSVIERSCANARATEAATAGAPWPERLRAVLAAGLSALAEHPHEARIAFVEVLAAGPAALRRRATVIAELARLFEPGYAAAGSRAAVPKLMPMAIAGAFDEVVRGHVADGRIAELPALLPDLLFCALAPFLGPAEAAKLAARDALHVPA
jgi:AcrR family transcriptional regulator